MAIIGIDLGTTNSLVSVFRDGNIELIPNSVGEYLTPSVVSFGENGEIFVGKIAKEMLVTKPDRTFKEFKRNMGTGYIYSVDNNNYKAEELSALVLRKLKEDAEEYLGETVTEAVISVPAYFNDDKRCATKNAGQLAGLKVERLINEPSAVALKHHTMNEEMENFIIFDFGGGTLDVSLVEAYDNMVEIRAVAGDNYLGGKDFNEAIAENFYKKFIPKEKLSLEDQNIVLKEAEQLKIALSSKNQASRTFFLSGKEYTMSLSNQELIHIAAYLFKKMSEPIKKVLNDSKMSWDEIDKIILVGGSSKMPVVKQYISSISEVPVIMDDNPDASIALGVGMAATIKERVGGFKDLILSDICPFSLGVEIVGGVFSPIIERNDTLPCSKSRYYVTIKDFQEVLEFNIYQGESMVARENLSLGTLEITDIPQVKAGQTGVNVTFMYDINGILDIRIVGENQSIHKTILNKKIQLSETELQEKLDELKQLSMHPLGKERDRLLIERAKSLYMESNGEVRNNLATLIRDYEELLATKNEQMIRQGYVKIMLYLDALEKQRVVVDEFDESFWEKEKFDDSMLDKDE